MKAVISNARTRFANGKHQAAIRLLEDFQPPSHPEIVAALSELRAAPRKIEEEQRLEQERIERQERVAALARGGATPRCANSDSMRRSTFSRARPRSMPTRPELVTLREQVRQEQAAALSNAELAHMLADLDEHLTPGDLSAAARSADRRDDARSGRPARAGRPPARRTGAAAREAAEARARDRRGQARRRRGAVRTRRPARRACAC